jgi:hypothetical protein
MTIKVSRKWLIVVTISLGLVAAVWAVGTVLAQGPDPNTILRPAAGSPTETFVYQGYLEDGGVPANGSYDFIISIWSDELAGVKLAEHDWSPWGVDVVDGVYAINVPATPYGLVFNGDPRWLEVEVRPHGVGGYTTLPRQAFAGSPYAWGMRPRAVISGTTSNTTGFGNAILNVQNSRELYGGGNSNALFARATTGSAVRGESGGIGVHGYSDWTYAIRGESDNGEGGYFTSNEGYGLYAESSGTEHYDHGAHVSSNYGYGIYVTSDENMALRAESPPNLSGITQPTGHIGVFGAGAARGVVGSSDSGYGVTGWSTSGWAGHFSSGTGDGVYISAAGTGLNVASGSKSAVVRTDEGSRLLYTEESTEVWFTDYGFGRLEGGAAVVSIDPLFAQTVAMDEPYHVFVQVYGNAEVYVSGRTATQFEVHLRDGDPDVEFSYRIVAKRLGFEGDRLEPAPWADSDPNLYPELYADSGPFQTEVGHAPGGGR